MIEVSAKIRVVIDARYWRGDRQTGVERYVRLLIEALGNEAVSNQIDALGLVVLKSHMDGRQVPAVGDTVAQFLPVSNRGASALERALAAFEPSVVHFPFDLPVTWAYPSVYTLHDPGRYLFPNLMTKSVREEQSPRLVEALNAGSLDVLLTVSNASAADIHECLDVHDTPVVVAPNFVSDDFRRLLTQRLPMPPGINAPFLLSVGVYAPTKNVPRMCRAFRLARLSAPDVVPPRLVLAGRLGWDRGITSLINRSRDIAALGHIEDEMLAALYRHTTALVQPSLYEGFGIPVLEALSALTPVLCADIPVFREIAGELALYCDPLSEAAMAAAIVARCRQAGPTKPTTERWVRRFSASATARSILAAYRLAIDRWHHADAGRNAAFRPHSSFSSSHVSRSAP